MIDIPAIPEDEAGRIAWHREVGRAQGRDLVRRAVLLDGRPTHHAVTFELPSEYGRLAGESFSRGVTEALITFRVADELVHRIRAAMKGAADA